VVAALVDNEIVEPAQYGPVLAADVVGVVTTTVTEPALEHPSELTVTVYTPALIVVAEGIVGFCRFDEKELGPAQV
jgi:hypothetical protein